MPTSLGHLVSFLRRLAPPGSEEDVVLLTQFAQGDSAAFTALVGKYAPLVWGVCRRLLGPSPDAEDAFQATFVVFVQKATGLADGRPLGPWLHKVASRTATKARARAAKRQARETSLVIEPTTCDAEHASQRELSAILEEELGRLPEHYRRPMVLCYLEGLTNEEAAKRLDCPKGTILSRLSRAREQLRERLERRGLDLSSVMLPAVLTAEAAPSALVETVITAGPLLRVGVTTGLTSSALILAKGVVMSMFLRKLEMVGLVLVAMAVMATGAGWWTHQGGGGGSGVQAAEPVAADEKTPPAKTETKTAEPAASEQPQMLRGEELRALIGKTVDFPGIEYPKTTVIEAINELAKFHRITFDINERAFKKDANDSDVVNKSLVADPNPMPPMKTSLHVVLTKILGRIPTDTVYLLRKDRIEITTMKAAREELNLPGDAPFVLVHGDFRDVAASEAFKKLMDDSEANIVVDPRCGDLAKMQFTGRMMNVPMDTAITLIADAAGLVVVKKNNVYYVTTSENANKVRKELR